MLAIDKTKETTNLSKTVGIVTYFRCFSGFKMSCGVGVLLLLLLLLLFLLRVLLLLLLLSLFLLLLLLLLLLLVLLLLRSSSSSSSSSVNSWKNLTILVPSSQSAIVRCRDA